MGYLYSTSYSSPPVLGNKQEAFEADIWARLRELDPTEQFREPDTIEIIVVRKPI
jgi:hypothetical protein